MNTQKDIHIKISKELYTKLKIKCAYNGISMQDYITQLLNKEMESRSGEKRSILIVDDEKIMRDSLKDWLHQNYGYDVETVETGEDAIELVKKQDFDTIVLDVRLAGKGGIEVLKEIKAIKPQIKCIIITAYPQVDLAVEAIKAGAIDYLVKPFSPSQLERLI
jgi:heterodisulfide reductase subunit A